MNIHGSFLHLPRKTIITYPAGISIVLDSRDLNCIYVMNVLTLYGQSSNHLYKLNAHIYLNGTSMYKLFSYQIRTEMTVRLVEKYLYAYTHTHMHLI